MGNKKISLKAKVYLFQHLIEYIFKTIKILHNK